MNAIGILKFVHQNIAEALAVMVQDMRFIQPQLVRSQQQLGEIHQPGAVAGFLIGLINPLPGLLYRIAVAFDMLGTQTFVFLPLMYHIA